MICTGKPPPIKEKILLKAGKCYVTLHVSIFVVISLKKQTMPWDEANTVIVVVFLIELILKFLVSWSFKLLGRRAKLAFHGKVSQRARLVVLIMPHLEDHSTYSDSGDSCGALLSHIQVASIGKKTFVHVLLPGLLVFSKTFFTDIPSWELTYLLKCPPGGIC